MAAAKYIDDFAYCFVFLIPVDATIGYQSTALSIAPALRLCLAIDHTNHVPSI